jgi:hypothetical protein
MRIAPNGTMVGKQSFDRAHTGSDTGADFKILAAGPDQKLVKDSQGPLTDSSYSDQFPMLSVAPGDFVAIKYRENGHVSRADDDQPQKAVNRGTVYLYGTTENDLSSLSLLDVHLKWTAKGDGKGRLLATRNYDDGQCHETLSGAGDIEGIVGFRMKAISDGAVKLPCQNDIQIPEDAPVGKVYTVIWVWDWSTLDKQGIAVPPATIPTNPEIYTGVVDYKIVDPCDDSLGSLKGPTCKDGAPPKAEFIADQPASARAIASQLTEPFIVKFSQAGFDVPSATADPKHIPFANLIGKIVGGDKPDIPLPLPDNILQGQNFATMVGGSGSGSGSGSGAGDKGDKANAGATATAAPTAAPTGGENAERDLVVTLTTTVAKGMVTTTVTRDTAKRTGAPRIRGRAW